MAVGIEHISNAEINHVASGSTGNFTSEGITIIRDSRFIRQICEPNRPYRIDDARLMRVVSGRAVYEVNMITYQLDSSHVVFVPKGSIINVIEATDDFTVEGVSVPALDEKVAFHEVWLQQLNTADWQRMTEYIDLLWRIVHKPSYSMDTVHYLQMAMFSDLHHLYQTAAEQSQQKVSKVQKTFSDFVSLVNRYGYREHQIAFYADKLCLTPNRLSTLVKQNSGQTVKEWITRAILQEAMIKLRYSDFRNYEIADHLNFPNASFFNKYFKEHTGMTPVEYAETSKKP